jgi:DNA-binding SARP family transcriptional activator/ABC-type oligopeptide transport system substrate-binding subunit
MLLLHRNEALSKERLIEGLWGSSPPPAAEPTLKTYISRLRRVLPDDERGARLTTRPPGYRLRVEAGELDVERFQALLSRGRTALAAGDASAAREALQQGISLFRGAPLEDLAYVPFAQAEVGRLEELRLSALELRLESGLETGDLAEAVGELESLVVRYPFREVLWSQLMLALYRSGRQGDALLAFDRARRTLTEELGVDPGQPLQRLHKRILRQDPALEAVRPSAGSAAVAAIGRLPPQPAPTMEGGQPSVAASTPPPVAAESPVRPPPGEGRTRPRLPGGRWIAAAVVSMALVVVLVAVLLPRLLAGGRGASTAYAPGTVLIDLATGHVIRSIARTDLAVAAYPIFADGHFWVNNWSPSAYVEIDPRTGKILKQISPPARDPNIHRDFDTVTPFTVQGDALWVTSADDLVKMDIGLAREVGRFKLDDLGNGSGLAEGVAVGGGSVWVSRDVGQGQILRLDPITGAVQHAWNNITPYLNLAYGDGSLWMADERGIARIDAGTNAISLVNGIQNNCGGGAGGCVVAGGGFGWTDDGSKGAIYKVDRAGHIATTYPAEIGAGFMSYANGVLWVGNYDDGTVIGVDTVTGKKATTYRFGHPAGDVAAGDGVLLLSLGPTRPFEARIDSLPGTVAKFFAHAGELGGGDESALSTDPAAYEIEYATCAKLLNYPDAPPPEGLRLRPEVAASMPKVSADGRTYTFTVRPGYRFSPPSNQAVTAETFRYSIERALSPRLEDNPTGQIPPGPLVLDDIEGEQAFRDGAAEHVSGLRAQGDTLSITLVEPSPDFLERLALPFFCPVPTGTPFVGGGPRTGPDGGIYSAGPYYVADWANGSYVILKRNPNYHGPRPHLLDAIAIREDAAASAALDRVQSQGWDGITSLSDPLLEPGGLVDQQWGMGSAAAANGDQRYFLTPEEQTRFVAFNASRGIFTDPRVRKAAAMALDRDALAAAWGDLPSDQILPPAVPGHRDRDLYPRGPSAAKARALMLGRTGHAVMPIPSDCDSCADVAKVVQTDLAGIGINVQIRKVNNLADALKGGAKFDLLDTETGILYPDSASFLEQMLGNIPSGWIPAGVQAEIQHVATLTGDHRQAAATALADRLATEAISVAAYGTPQTSQFVGPRVGCRVFTPVGYGLDLAALCPKQSSS